ncbi:uncharacterized protein CELE_Y38E10A.1 [Caenorhabditis elegans]|uniref:Secreted protein n=1 Tax=Caenorhabditis elegans TaxID=6239 RepID=A0A486WV89_CAEEL|nr:Secreted protein [Caenorhabditis elegans]VGM69494.1 Secreted protein [Caenorhabditis elegans]
MIYPFILLSLTSIAEANYFSSDPFQFSTSCDPNLETTTTEVAETSTTPYHPMAWDFKDFTHSLTQEQSFNELMYLTTNGLVNNICTG